MKKKEANTKKVEKTKEEPKKENPKAKWYVVNTYSGHETKVANQIKARVKANAIEDIVLDVVIPTQDKIVISNGKKRTVKERIYPGYILVNMELQDNSWHIVKNTEGVIGFIGNKKNPTPISDKEASAIINFMSVTQPTYHSSFNVGDTVKVAEGPFADHVGRISEINKDKGQVKVLLSFFGQETPVVFDFLQVKKLQ